MTDPKPKWHFVKPWDRHGLILLTVGLMYTLIGIAFMLSDETQARRDNMRYALYIMEYDKWCAVFILVGFIAIVSARWPSTPRTLGYATLTGWTCLWSGFYIIGGLSDPVNPSYVATGFVWAMVAFLWWAISGLICPPKERGRRGTAASPYSHDHSCRDIGIGGDRYTKGSSESEP